MTGRSSCSADRDDERAPRDRGARPDIQAIRNQSRSELGDGLGAVVRHGHEPGRSRRTHSENGIHATRPAVGSRSSAGAQGPSVFRRSAFDGHPRRCHVSGRSSGHPASRRPPGPAASTRRSPGASEAAEPLLKRADQAGRVAGILILPVREDLRQRQVGPALDLPAPTPLVLRLDRRDALGSLELG